MESQVTSEKIKNDDLIGEVTKLTAELKQLKQNEDVSCFKENREELNSFEKKENQNQNETGFEQVEEQIGKVNIKESIISEIEEIGSKQPVLGEERLEETVGIITVLPDDIGWDDEPDLDFIEVPGDEEEPKDEIKESQPEEA